MKGLSRRMKRLLAILVVEVIVAINVLSAYADNSDENFTMTDQEVVDLINSTSGGEEVVISDVVTFEEPVFEEPVAEEPVAVWQYWQVTGF